MTAANLRQYLSAVVDATLGAGVAAQVAAFRSGFDAIFPLDSLAAFYEDEIEVMLCGEWGRGGDGGGWHLVPPGESAVGSPESVVGRPKSVFRSR